MATDVLTAAEARNILQQDIENIDLDTVDETVIAYEKAINTYLQNLAQIDEIRFDLSYPVAIALQEVVDSLELASALYNEHSEVTNDVTVSGSEIFINISNWDPESPLNETIKFNITPETQARFNESKKRMTQEQELTDDVDKLRVATEYVKNDMPSWTGDVIDAIENYSTAMHELYAARRILNIDEENKAQTEINQALQTLKECGNSLEFPDPVHDTEKYQHLTKMIENEIAENEWHYINDGKDTAKSIPDDMRNEIQNKLRTALGLPEVGRSHDIGTQNIGIDIGNTLENMLNDIRTDSKEAEHHIAVNYSNDDIIGTAAFYMMGNEDLKLVFDQDEVNRRGGDEYIAYTIIEAFEHALIEWQWPDAKDDNKFKELNELASPMGKTVQLLEKSGYEVETQLKNDNIHADMTVTPDKNHRFSNAEYKIKIKDIDLTQDAQHVQGQLIINNIQVTDENREQMKKDYDKIVNKEQQVMKTINNPDRNLEMLKDHNNPMH